MAPRSETSDHADDERLPAELIWFYPALFVGSVALMSPQIAHAPWRSLVSRLVISAMAWSALSLSLHALYRSHVPRWVRPFAKGPARWAAHIGIVAAAASALSVVLWVAVRLALPRAELTLTVFWLQCVAISWAVVLPSLAIESLRQRSRIAEQRLAEARSATLQAQLTALQAQTNPHFLFNSINSVAALIPEDPALAERTLEQLADLFRYSLEGARSSRVALERELEFVQDFLALQRVRFGQRLDATLQVEPGVERASVLPLLVQPLVENAVEHGLHDRKHAVVRVRVARDNDRVIISVDDDGPGPDRSAHRGTQTSLDNLRSRLRAWSSDATLETGASALGGFHAQISFAFEPAP